MLEERPFHIQAIYDLRADYSPEHFRHAIRECRRVIAQLISEDNSSDRQIARVHILRYLDLQLGRAIQWAEHEADLMAIILRGQIDLRIWAEFVSLGPGEAAKFLNEVDIDIREIHDKMEKAFPGGMQPLPVPIPGKRTKLNDMRESDEEEYYFALCSKLLHPSVLMLKHPETTIWNAAIQKDVAVQVLRYAWRIVSCFHDLVWKN